jgi:hypothetical protein
VSTNASTFGEHLDKKSLWFGETVPQRTIVVDKLLPIKFLFFLLKILFYPQMESPKETIPRDHGIFESDGNKHKHKHSLQDLLKKNDTSSSASAMPPRPVLLHVPLDGADLNYAIASICIHSKDWVLFNANLKESNCLFHKVASSLPQQQTGKEEIHDMTNETKSTREV